MPKKEQYILNYIKGNEGATAKQVTSATWIADSTANNLLTKLIQDGELYRYKAKPDGSKSCYHYTTKPQLSLYKPNPKTKITTPKAETAISTSAMCLTLVLMVAFGVITGLALAYGMSVWK